MMNNDMNANVIAARTALTPIVWGTTYAVTTTWLPAGHPVTAGLLRALPAGLILILITRTLPTGSWWWRSAVLGILNIGLFFTLLFPRRCCCHPHKHLSTCRNGHISFSIRN